MYIELKQRTNGEWVEKLDPASPSGRTYSMIDHGPGKNTKYVTLDEFYKIPRRGKETFEERKSRTDEELKHLGFT